jgi:ABC-type multidrug transport system fused ATPase/permease subunit
LNRFANDQDDVDSSLPLTVASFLVEACKVLCQLKCFASCFLSAFSVWFTQCISISKLCSVLYDQQVIGVLTLATIAVPPFALVVPFVAYAFMGVTERYRRSSREVQRLLAISRSPLFTTVEEALVGLVTIRAFNVQKRQQQQQHAHSSPTNSHSRQSSFQDVFNARVRASTAWAYMKLALDQVVELFRALL